MFPVFKTKYEWHHASRLKKQKSLTKNVFSVSKQGAWDFDDKAEYSDDEGDDGELLEDDKVTLKI